MNKRLAITVGLVLVIVAAVVPAMAQGMGWGRGGGYGSGHHMGGGYGPGIQNMDQEKVKAIFEARTKFFNDTNKLRQQMVTKRLEFQTLLSDPKTTREALLAKQKELQVLNNDLEAKRLGFRKDLQAQFPELSNFNGRGSGWGGWIGMHGQGGGRGWRQGGGPDYGYNCWNNRGS